MQASYHYNSLTIDGFTSTGVHIFYSFILPLYTIANKQDIGCLQIFPIPDRIDPLISHNLDNHVFTQILRIGMILYIHVCSTASFNYFQNPLTRLDKLLKLLHVTQLIKVKYCSYNLTPGSLVLTH